MVRQAGGTTAGFSTASQPVAMARPGLSSVPMLTVVAHPAIDRIGERAILSGLVGDRAVELSRSHPYFCAPGSGRPLPLEDRFMSRRPLLLRPAADGGVDLARGACRTPVAVDGRPLRGDGHLLSGAALDDGVVLELAGRVALLLHRRPPPVAPPPPGFGMVGESHGVELVRAAIARVASLDVPVLITGATGTGKELVARALHHSGARRDGPFVAVNIGALAPSLATAELLGARRGAFTGATHDRRGYFARADGGTLFLDEIGEASPEVQVLLLRVLERGEITAVGDTKPRRVDVRVVAATDADLEQLVFEGRFRAPLLHRLAGYPIRLPLLRHRRGDIGRLLVHFLRQERARLALAWPPSAADARQPWLPGVLAARLTRAPWPGNVRQLGNVARQLVIDECDGVLGGDSLASLARASDNPVAGPAGSIQSIATPASPRQPAPGSGRGAPAKRKPSEVDEDELVMALRDHRFNLKAAAATLGISRTSIYALIERSDRVRFAADLSPGEIEAAWRDHAGEVSAMVMTLEVSERGLRQRLRDLGLRRVAP